MKSLNDIHIIEVTADNVEVAGLCCVKNNKSPGYKAKVEWFRQKANEGLKIRIALDNEGKQIGFIEYIPSERAWRPVKADNYLFIQCIAVYVKDWRNTGIGSTLIKECEDEAKALNKNGIFSIASDGTWMADKSLFEKSGFVAIQHKDRFDLMVKRFIEAPSPVFAEWDIELTKYRGWNLVYADQCPWHQKSVADLYSAAKVSGIELKLSKLESPEASQNAPSGFGTFSLIYDGKLLADHYISETRFNNIIKQISSS